MSKKLNINTKEEVTPGEKLNVDDLKSLNTGDEFYMTDKYDSEKVHDCKVIRNEDNLLQYEEKDGSINNTYLSGFNEEGDKELLGGKYKTSFYSK